MPHQLSTKHGMALYFDQNDFFCKSMLFSNGIVLCHSRFGFYVFVTIFGVCPPHSPDCTDLSYIWSGYSFPRGLIILCVKALL